jgi:hypothetical protein
MFNLEQATKAQSGSRGARWGWVVKVQAAAALPPGNIHGTNCTGSWVGPRAGLDRCGKSRPQQHSIPGQPSP